jgi:importin-7
MNLDSVEQLHIVLQQSFSPDVNQRGPAEEAIRNLKNVPGSTTLLLKIASEKQVSKKSRGCSTFGRRSSQEVHYVPMLRFF